MFDSHPDLLVNHSCELGGCTWGYSGRRRGLTPCHTSTRTANCRFPQYQKKKKSVFGSRKKGSREKRKYFDRSS
jgi:hypothetical protein